MPDTIAVKDSILQSTKKLLGFSREDESFDLDIMTGINSAFSTLYQAGVGPVEGLIVTDENDSWAQFMGNQMHIQNVKSFVFLHVKLLFDIATATSFALAAYQSQLEELIWRLNVAADFTVTHELILDGTESQILWDLTGGIDFPFEAPVGAHGIDLNTNITYVKS